MVRIQIEQWVIYIFCDAAGFMMKVSERVVGNLLNVIKMDI